VVDVGGLIAARYGCVRGKGYSATGQDTRQTPVPVCIISRTALSHLALAAAAAAAAASDAAMCLVASLSNIVRVVASFFL